MVSFPASAVAQATGSSDPRPSECRVRLAGAAVIAVYPRRHSCATRIKTFFDSSDSPSAEDVLQPCGAVGPIRQQPDGTVIWTAPTGHSYTTEPHGGVLFSALKQSTGEVATRPAIDVPETDRGVMMPTRKQTRDQNRRDRIAQERRERTELIAEEERQRRAWLAANYEPPPF